MIRRFIVVYFFVQISIAFFGQTSMGGWRTHFAYNSVNQITQSSNKVYALSDGALFSIDKVDRNTEYYSKLTGLTGSNIIRIKYDNTSNQLLVVYQNGNIDIIGKDGVRNISDLQLKQMSVSKYVNQIVFSGDLAYLSCDFGIVVIQMRKHEIQDSYFIGANGSDVRILATALLNDSIFSVSTTELYMASSSDPFLVNYQKWTTQSYLPGSGNIQTIVAHNGKLFLLRNNKVYKREDNYSWSEPFSTLTINDIVVSNGSLSLIVNNDIYLVDSNNQANQVMGLGAPLKDVEFDPKNLSYWFAASDMGILSYKKSGEATPIISTYKPNGPAFNSPWDITFSGDKLFVVPGGRWYAQNNSSGAVMIYKSGQWSNISEQSISDNTSNRAKDFMNVAVNPKDESHFFVTSYGTGLYEFKDDKFYKWHTPTNSPLESVIPNDPNNYTRLDGAVFDNSGILYLINMIPGKKISMKALDASGNWTTLDYYVNISQTVLPTLGKITISKKYPNMKWIPSHRHAPGLFVVDNNQTPLDAVDDRFKFLSGFKYMELDNNKQPVEQEIFPSVVSCIIEDLKGVIWVGTNNGPVLAKDPSKIFDNNFYFSRVLIPRNDGSGLADPLLSTEYVKCMAVDGANRKWIGTETSGVYLMSENGEETIKHFTTENSPLSSNNILSIAIHPKSGEVFIGTSSGLLSYQSDANLGENNFTNVYAYPNPVREGYNGLITITGLMENTHVKITDLTGNLICETISNGGLATWDGKDGHGRKVSTGIYLAICANEDGTKSAITKILVIN